MAKKLRTLLEIKSYELTGNDIGYLKKSFAESNRFNEKVLPNYCVREDNGEFAHSDYYFQFVETGEEKFLLFDADTIDDVLKEEISGAGIDSILKDIDLRPYFKELYHFNKDNVFRHHLMPSQYLIIQIEYVECGSWEYPEWEAQYSIEGVLKY